MYSVVIADDEPLICKGLKKMIETMNKNFSVIKTFPNGEELLLYLKNNDVDAVFTDVMMNDTSGLQIAEYLHKNKPYISCVIISGYEKFEYAKTALEFGVKKYLLKPVVAHELDNLLSLLQEQLKSSQEEFFTSANDYANLSVRQLITDILTGTLNKKEEICSRAAAVPNSQIDCSLPCLIMKITLLDYEKLITSWKYDKEQLADSVYNFLKQNMGENFYLAGSKDNIFTAVFFNVTDNTVPLLKSGTIQEDFFEVFKSRFSVEYTKKPDVFSVYNDADIFAFFNELSDNEGLIFKMLMIKLNSESLDEVKKLFDTICKNQRSLSPENYRSFIIKLFTEIFSKLSALGINLPKHIYFSANYSAISELETAEEIDAWSLKLLKQIFDSLRDEKNSDFDLIIKVDEYINAHLEDDISLDDISGYVYLSPIYFSRYFKKCTGENFSSYLIRKRIEKAKELLSETNLKVYQIGEKTGFGSIYYFNRVFKQYTGLTPNEYRKGE